MIEKAPGTSKHKDYGLIGPIRESALTVALHVLQIMLHSAAFWRYTGDALHVVL